MDRPCDTCGTTYSAKSSRSRFCSDLCRARNQGKPADSGRRESTDTPGAVYAAALVELEAAGRATSADGMACLALARLIDGGAEGSAAASIVKQFHASKAEALKDSQVAATPLDELRRRRDAKRAAG